MRSATDPAIDFDAVWTAADVTRVVQEIFGEALPVNGGVIHPTAVWRAPGDRYCTLRINDESPRSRHDRFMLNLARCRADALVTTGKILREEPALTTDLLGDGPERDALLSWRRQVLDRTEAPVVLVLTSGRALDLDHPALHSWAEPLVFTTHEAADELFDRALARGIEIVSHEEPSIRAALEYLTQSLGCATVSIEAGSSSSVEAYRGPCLVDEVMLSVFEDAIPDSVRGPDFLAPSRLEALFGPGTQPYRVDEPSGRWEFRRLVRSGGLKSKPGPGPLV